MGECADCWRIAAAVGDEKARCMSCLLRAAEADRDRYKLMLERTKECEAEALDSRNKLLGQGVEESLELEEVKADRDRFRAERDAERAEMASVCDLLAVRCRENAAFGADWEHTSSTASDMVDGLGDRCARLDRACQGLRADRDRLRAALEEIVELGLVSRETRIALKALEGGGDGVG